MDIANEISLQIKYILLTLNEDGIHVHPKRINDAHRGNPSALYHIGTKYYEKGCYEKAMRFYVLSGAKGNIKAMHQMGDMFRKGYGVSKDMRCAINWYTKGAKLDRTGFCSKIALIFEYGEGVNRNVYKALEWHHKDRIGQCFVAALNKEGHHLLEQDKNKTIGTLIKETQEILQSEKVSLVERKETCSGIPLKMLHHNYTKVVLLFVVIVVVMVFLLSP